MEQCMNKYRKDSESALERGRQSDMEKHGYEINDAGGTRVPFW